MFRACVRFVLCDADLFFCVFVASFCLGIFFLCVLCHFWCLLYRSFVFVVIQLRVAFGGCVCLIPGTCFVFCSAHEPYVLFFVCIFVLVVLVFNEFSFTVLAFSSWWTISWEVSF